MLDDFRGSIEVIGEAANGIKGKELIEQLKPDVIFLDIQMPVQTGFEMLEGLKSSPNIVFTTAYEEYAVRAFEENSVDYLLKPFDSQRLQQTIERLEEKKQTGSSDWDDIKKTISGFLEKPEPGSITVKLGDRILLVRLSEISFLKAEDKYVFIHTKDDKRYIIDKSLKRMSEQLPHHFVRIHRAYIINFDHILEIRKSIRSQYVFKLNDAGNTTIVGGTGYNEQIKERLAL